MSARRALGPAAAAIALALLAGCTVGPDYQRPAAPTSAAFKEMAGWKRAEPQETGAGGSWWSVYRDPILDDLERQVEISNQNLAAAEAAFRQARAVAQAARAGLFPTLTAAASNSPASLGSGRATAKKGGVVSSQFDVSATASWDLDIWGRIRRTVEGDVASAQASAADLAAARLSAETELANDYLMLRIADELKRLLDASADAYGRSLEITRNRYKSGVASEGDVAAAQTQLETTRAQAINVGVQRAQLEHAIAVLIGKPPAELTIVAGPLTAAVPDVPVGVPSALLERRPDIASAERKMAAANAQIGATEAAFYPDITLSGAFGFTASVAGMLLQASNQLWSLGASLAATLFDGGARSATLAQARAGYDETVATYRQTVLTAFQQVENQLAALRVLAEQAEVQAAAVRSAQEAERIALNQYRAGTVPYTSVIVAQTAALTNEQTALNLRQAQLTASVNLIQALGGGWSSGRLPTEAEIQHGRPAEGARQ
jgi:NodT family efflux transporter outer membrane factor (OMF) lipoprotein